MNLLKFSMNDRDTFRVFMLNNPFFLTHRCSLKYFNILLKLKMLFNVNDSFLYETRIFECQTILVPPLLKIRGVFHLAGFFHSPGFFLSSRLFFFIPLLTESLIFIQNLKIFKEMGFEHFSVLVKKI